MVRSGARFADILMSINPVQAIRVAKLCVPLVESRRDWRPNVKWHWGPAGTGRTRTAYEELGSADVCHLQAASFRWWDGYGAYENVVIVLINELRRSRCKLHELLALLTGILSAFNAPIPSTAHYRQV